MLAYLELSTVHEIIRLAARARTARTNLKIPVSKSSRSEGLRLISAADIAYPPASTPEESDLETYLGHLSDEQMAELMALMWLGRVGGLQRASAYPSLVDLASKNLAHAALYLAGKVRLADDLREGLRKLKLRRPSRRCEPGGIG